MTCDKKRIVVVGGGIAGLAAAQRFVEVCEKKDCEQKDIELLLFESTSHIGGVIKTTEAHDCLLEEGPDAFITQKPWALALCQRLQIQDSLQNTRSRDASTMIVRNGKLHRVPEGFMMLAPTKLRPFLFSPLFSPFGKLRMAMEYFIPPAPDRGDETLEEFVVRRLGREALERIAQPLVSGIYTADPARLSLKATMPRFLEMEQAYGGLLRALLRKSPGHSEKSPYSMFVAPREGLGDLVKRIRARLPQGSVFTDTAVTSISRSADTGRYRVLTSRNEIIDADAVIVASPARSAARILREIDTDLSALLSHIRFSSTAVLNLVFAEEDIEGDLNGSGFVVPAVERLNILACTFSSNKFARRARAGLILMRAFLGGEMRTEILDYDDHELESLVLADLKKLLGIYRAPRYSKLTRHVSVMPQYDVGHCRRLDSIDSLLCNHPGLELAGNSYQGVGIPDCIRSGEAAADRVVSYLQETGCIVSSARLSKA